jgi:hypothetical protein
LDHVITVRDPWFSPYVKVFLNVGGVPDVVLGPLLERKLHYAGLKNFGTQVEHSRTREKSVDHHYASGTITGNVPEPDHSNFYRTVAFDIEGGGDSAEIIETYPAMDPPNNTIIRRWSVWATGGRIAPVVTQTYIVSLGWKTEYIEWGTPTTHEGGARLSLSVSVDQYTGSITYGDATVLEVWGDQPPNPVIAAIDCPYGASTTNHLIPLVQSATFYVDRALGVLRQLPLDVNLRNEAIWSAVENIELAQLNALTDFTDVQSPLASLKQVGKFFEIHSEALQFVKKLANMHLYWQYVVKMNILTTQECSKLVSFLKGNSGTRNRDITNGELIGHGTARKTVNVPGGTVTRTYTAKVVYGSGWSPQGSFAELQLLGVMPGIDDLWDAVPYSFVVDWAVPVQEHLTRAQKLVDLIHLPMICLVLGYKDVATFSQDIQGDEHVFHLDISATLYRRRVHDSLPLNMSLGALATHSPWVHSLTGTELILQRVL